MRCLGQARGFRCRNEIAFDADAVRMGRTNALMFAENGIESVDETFRIRLGIRMRYRNCRKGRDERGGNKPVGYH